MKKYFLLICMMAAVQAFSQSASEVIEKYSANIGGLDAINKVKTAKMTGIVSIQGMDLPLTTQVVNGKAMRVDVDVDGQSVTNVYNNGTGWKINPFAGAPEATDVTGTELNDFKAQASLSNNLVDYKARGNKVELLGKETIEGVETYKIKLTAADDGKETTYYISTADYTLVKSSTTRQMMGQDAQVDTFYSDYKVFGGLKFATLRRIEADGQEIQSIALSNVELNVPVDEAIFSK